MNRGKRGGNMEKILVGDHSPTFPKGGAQVVKPLRLEGLTAAMHKSRLEDQLLPTAQALVQPSETRRYNDFNYEINHREFCHLLGERDRNRILGSEDPPPLLGPLETRLESRRFFEV